MTENASRRRGFYSIRSDDSPVTVGEIGVTFSPVLDIVLALLSAVTGAFRSRASLVGEILVLRQQLAVLKRCRPRPPLRPIDRAFWVAVSRVWSRWADALVIVKPATVVA
ncbi:MAG TPA: hypothetical protein VN848_01120 [Gemmatimonadales bacterium]|nr:hypothetical protein [Gemmatimonadales bacterium]